MGKTLASKGLCPCIAFGLGTLLYCDCWIGVNVKKVMKLGGFMTTLKRCFFLCK